MSYPTREQAERIATELCVDDNCHECDIEQWCYDTNSIMRGRSMVTMHDEIDKLKDKIEVYVDTILELEDEIKKLKTDLDIAETTNPIRDLCNELIKAREAIAKRDDLIRRMAEWILRNRTPSTWTIPLTPGPYEIDVRRKIIFNGSNVLLSEANELMGVK